MIVVGAFYVNPANWKPFAPYGWRGLSFFGITALRRDARRQAGRHARRGGDHLLRLHRLRLGLDPRRGGARTRRRDVPIGIIASLIICTVLYIAVAAVLTGMVRTTRSTSSAGVSGAFRRSACPGREFIIAIAGGRRHHLGAAGHDAVGAARLAGHGPRRPGARELLRRRPPDASGPPGSRTILIGVFVATAGRRSCRSTSCRPGQHRHPVRLRDRLRGGADHAQDATPRPAAVPRPARARWCRSSGILICLVLMFSLPAGQLAAAGRLAGPRPGHLLRVQPAPQRDAPPLPAGRPHRRQAPDRPGREVGRRAGVRAGCSEPAPQGRLGFGREL